MSQALHHASPLHSLSLAQYVTNLCDGLPRVVLDDVRFKLRLRTARDGAGDRALSLFAQDSVEKAKDVTGHIVRAFPFAAADHTQKGQVFLSHDVLMNEAACDNLAHRLSSLFVDIIQTLHWDADADNAYFANLLTAYERISGLLKECFIDPPALDFSGVGEKYTQEDAEAMLEAILQRCCEPDWIRRKLARLRKQYREHAQVALGNVGKGKHKRYYVSALTFSHFMTNLKKNERFMESMLVVNVDTEESYSLKEVAARTTANPDNRRVELIVRARGDVERAEDLGYESLFVSWTLPSKYHRNSAKWCGCTVKEAHRVLMDKWELVRSHFAKHDVPWFGLRVAEPHKDGTPHAHLFLHVPASYKDRAVCVLNEIACREDEDELYTPRLKKKRIDIKFADPQKDPVGYLVKYISKNVNGAHMPEGDADTRALAARAWCSTWNIKQFSQSGSPPVGLWRQIRRASKEDVAFDSELADLYDQCDNSRWKRFCQDIQDAKLAYDEHTNRYGETVKKVRGFTWHDTLIETAGQDFALVPSSKFDTWKAARASAFALALKKARRAVPWSTENKCNPTKKTAVSPLEHALMEVTGWSVKGVQCLLKPLSLGATVPIDKYLSVSLRNGELRTQTTQTT